ncbi:MAG TPA: hypothetical protein PLZ82_11755, partial [Smithellaceae bacterium]|nr:hypothetical protein [Smithella sp.]HQH06069.1 hypothetical protein [Smithellaceae bacterium]
CKNTTPIFRPVKSNVLSHYPQCNRKLTLYQVDISDADRRIDALVAELYGLTAAEIRLIEAD